MDVLAAYRAFVEVAERGSFTSGAAAVGVPQPVASRRVAALEAHLGSRLLDRSSRHVVLTPLGRDLLPSARRLVSVADALEDDARRGSISPLGLAVPPTCSVADLAHLAAGARLAGHPVDIRIDAQSQRARSVMTGDIRASLAVVAPDQGVWTVPLGLAAADRPRSGPVRLDSLRTSRSDLGPVRAVWVQAEDDGPHIRDRLKRAAEAAGLLKTQVRVAADLITGPAQVLASADLLLCSAHEADALGLHWRPVLEVELVRNYDVMAGLETDAVIVRTILWGGVARCLGARAAPARTP